MPELPVLELRPTISKNYYKEVPAPNKNDNRAQSLLKIQPTDRLNIDQPVGCQHHR